MHIVRDTEFPHAKVAWVAPLMPLANFTLENGILGFEGLAAMRLAYEGLPPDQDPKKLYSIPAEKTKYSGRNTPFSVVEGKPNPEGGPPDRFLVPGEDASMLSNS